jgi:hypothetical protein
MSKYSLQHPVHTSTLNVCSSLSERDQWECVTNYKITRVAVVCWYVSRWTARSWSM